MSTATHSIPVIRRPAAAARQGRSWRDSFSALSVPNFRIVAGANIVGMTAMWMQRVAQDWLVLQLTGSVAAVGVTTLAQFGPMLLFGLWGGLVVDRYPKRVLLMCTNAAVGAASILLAVLVLTHSATVLMVWAIAFVVGVVTVIDNPTRQVFANELVGPAHLRNAITLNSSVFQLGGLIGPAIAGGLIVAVGGGWAFAINALACCTVLLALTRLDTGALHPTVPTPRRRGQIVEGLRFALSTPAIRYSMLLMLCLATFALTMPVLLAAYANNVFHIGAGGYGLFNSLVAVGALTGALASTRRTVIRLRTVILCGGLWAAAQSVAAFMPSELSFGIALAACGFANQFFFMAGNPLVQMSTDPAIRGRVMAVWVMLLLGGQAIGGPVMGWVVDAVGPRAGMLLSGLVPALAAVAIGAVLAHRGHLHLAVHRPHHIPALHIEPRQVHSA